MRDQEGQFLSSEFKRPLMLREDNKKTAFSIEMSVFFSLFLCLCLSTALFAQDKELELDLDLSAPTVPLPKIFKPNIDLSGRGFTKEAGYPQQMAAREVLTLWQKEIGFNNMYRLQYNLWDIYQFSKDKQLKEKLLANYEEVIKNISESGGVVILDIFGTPPGMGKVLDNKSPPKDIRTFKSLLKATIKELSCNKKYNIWYEVWSAPDLDDFFLGRQQEYLLLYRAAAEAVKELEKENKIHIPIGGPGSSWWFQDLNGNSIMTPEKSLIYELIRYCYRYRLPLDFITWHGYSTSPKAEAELTTYNKNTVNLIRDWLTYFNFNRNTPLIVDEWNYDRDANMLPERSEKSFISASYIPSRIKKMHDAGLDNQIYFSLEDFQNNKEGIVRNLGVFSLDHELAEYRGSPKATYNVFKMLNSLGSDIFSVKLGDEFCGVIATRSNDDSLAILIYNYIDPEIGLNFLTSNIATLNNAERRFLLDLAKSDQFKKVLQGVLDIKPLRTSKRVKAILKKAKELSDQAKQLESNQRTMKMGIKNLQDNYLYERYTVDSFCASNCEFKAVEQKEVSIAAEPYQETLYLSPYSVNLIILKKKPKEEPLPQEEKAQQPESVLASPLPEGKVESAPVIEAVQVPVSAPAAENITQEKPVTVAIENITGMPAPVAGENLTNTTN
jgi:hypothetical protein